MDGGPNAIYRDFMTSSEGDRLDFVIPDLRAVDVRIVGGDVTITAAPSSAGSEGRVDIVVTSGPEASVEIEDGDLRVVHEPLRSWSGLLAGVTGVRADVNITAPEGTAVTVRSVSGDVFVAGFVAETNLTSVSGRLTMTAGDGEMSLRSVSGDLEIDGVGGELRANTVSGDVTAVRVSADVAARSVSGNVALDLDEPGEVTCTTVSGEIAVRLAGDAAVDVDATSHSGHLESEFSGPSGSRRRLAGPIGGGGPRVALRSTSGDITLLRRQTAGATTGTGDR